MVARERECVCAFCGGHRHSRVFLTIPSTKIDEISEVHDSTKVSPADILILQQDDRSFRAGSRLPLKLDANILHQMLGCPAQRTAS
jgi:hypothetical protein